MPDDDDCRIDTFISRWRPCDRFERADDIMCLTEFCPLLDLPQPEPGTTG